MKRMSVRSRHAFHMQLTSQEAINEKPVQALAAATLAVLRAARKAVRYQGDTLEDFGR